jgi:hypothetical protein
MGHNLEQISTEMVRLMPVRFVLLPKPKELGLFAMKVYPEDAEQFCCRSRISNRV